MNIANIKKIKKTWIARADNRGIIGNNETRKTTFLTRKEFAIILLVPEENPSAK